MTSYADAKREQRLKELREQFFRPSPAPTPRKTLDDLKAEAATTRIEASEELLDLMAEKANPARNVA